MSEDSKIMSRDQFAEVYARAWNDAIEHPERYGDIFEGYENDHTKALGLITWQKAEIDSLKKRLEITEGMIKTGAWEKSDAVKVQQALLRAVRREIHDKAVYSHSMAIESYVTLKVVDAIIGNYLRKLEEGIQ